MPKEEKYEFPELRKKKRRSSREVDIDRLINAIKVREDKISSLQAETKDRPKELRPTQDLTQIRIKQLMIESKAFRKEVVRRAKELGINFDDEVIEEFKIHSVLSASERKDALYDHVMKTHLRRHPAEKGKLHEFYAERYGTTVPKIKDDLKALHKKPEFKARFKKLRKYR